MMGQTKSLNEFTLPPKRIYLVFNCEALLADVRIIRIIIEKSDKKRGDIDVGKKKG